MNIKKKLSTLLSFTLLLTSIPTQAFTQPVSLGEQTTGINIRQTTTPGAIQTTTPGAIQLEKHIYEGDGYEVEFKVESYWDDRFEGKFIVRNTGEETIENWSLGFDFSHEITQIWETQIVEHEDSSYIIKNLGYNQDIEPNEAIQIGFIANYEENITVPKSYDMLIAQQEAQDYEINFKVTSDWGTGFNGEVSITNKSEEPIEDWQLEFDFDREIDNFWTAKIIEHVDNHYVVKNDGYNVNIAPNETITLGFGGSPGNVIDSPTNFKLHQIGQKIDLEKDTDGDGLRDYIENLIGTNPKKADTDGDGLPDGYEYMYLNTDPLKQDTDDNDVKDSEEDFDEDRLTNIEEYLLGTDPFSCETDGDGLLDGDEVNIYGTDPLNPDTDNDGVLDGDEILLGLNPNDSLDGETPVTQVISEEEMRVNRYNDNFKISIDVDASNNVKRFLKQDVSRYSGFLSDNKAIVGIPVNIEYQAGTITSGTIKFKLDDDFVNSNPHYYSNLDLGIDRYGVFYYDEELSTIIPLPCDYDEEDNSIIVEAKYMGNLMIVDYESLMFDLGIEPKVEGHDVPMVMTFASDECESGNEIAMNNIEIDYFDNELTEFEDMSLEEIESIINGGNSIKSMNVADLSLFSDEETIQPSSTMRQVDLVLVVDTTGSMGSQIAKVKANLSTLISKLRADGISLYVSVVDYRDITCDGVNSTKVNNNSGVDFYNSLSDISSAISSLYPNGGGDGPETAIDGLGKAYYLNYRNSSAKFAFLITDATYKNNNNYSISNMTEMAQKLQSKGISTSVVTQPSIYNTYKELTTITGGELISMYGAFCDDMYKVIYNRTPESSVVIANNIVTGFFKEELVYGGSCDTDGDKLSDSSEVDWKNVKKVNEDGTYSLYTWKELCNKSWIFPSDYDDGKTNPLFKTMSDVLVIPAFSNPFSADTDKDYYPDNVDERKLVVDNMYIYDDGIKDSDFHNGTSITAKESDKYTDGKLVIDRNANTAKYSFTRRSKDVSYFTLTPNSTSFYKLTNKATGMKDVIVSYEKGWGLWAETVYVNPEKDGTYLLEQRIEYTIEVYGISSFEFDFTVEQDNWVYAPDGGIWERIKPANMINPGYEASKTLYITPKLLVDATCGKIDNGYEPYVVYTENDLKKVMTMVSADFTSELNTTVGAVCTGVGFAVVFLNPVTGTVGAIITFVGSTASIGGGLSLGWNVLENMKIKDIEEAIRSGNFHISYSMYPISIYNIYNSWNTDKYINKVQGGAVGKVSTNLTYQQVQEACGFTNYDN